MDMSSDFLTTLVAIVGTTISPYLFIWQSSQEAEDQRIDAARLPLKQHLKEAAPEFRRPPFAEIIFALGIIGTGLMAIPVLAGSTAYALAEGRKLPVGLPRNPKQAIILYVNLAAAGSAGVMIDFLPLDSIKALYWSAVINGIGPFVVRGWAYGLGWASTAAMTLCIIGMVASTILWLS